MAASDPKAGAAGTTGSGDVCSLPREALADRSALLQRDVFPYLTRRERLANGWALEFAHTPAMQRRLEDFVAFERTCCSGLEWDLTRPSADVLRVSIRGLAPDADFFRSLNRAAEPPATGPSRTPRRDCC